MKRCRILFVLTSPVRAGVEEVVLDLLTRLDRQFFEPALACPGPLLQAMASELRTLEVETFQVAADSWFKPREIAALASSIRRFRPDIVNAHLFRSTLVAAPLAKWLGVSKVVETYHGREAWRQGPIKGSFFVDRLVSHYVDLFVAVSEAAGRFLVEVKGIPREKITVIPNGRDLTAFLPQNGRGLAEARRRLDIPDKATVVGVVGRLEEQKGHCYLLDALPSVLADFPETHVLVVGDGSLRKHLEEQARELGVLSNIIFTGFRDDVPRLLNMMDLVVLPSLHEGMPLTAIEAAAIAKPIVATSVDGTPEVVQDGVTGRLVPPADPPALGEAILALLRNPLEAHRMGEAGRQNALARFDLSRQVEATAQAYRGVLGSQQRDH